jgi:hypothetical protein
LRVAVPLGDPGLAFQRLGVDPQVREADLAGADGIEGQVVHRPPG